MDNLECLESLVDKENQLVLHACLYVALIVYHLAIHYRAKRVIPVQMEILEHLVKLESLGDQYVHILIFINSYETSFVFRDHQELQVIQELLDCLVELENQYVMKDLSCTVYLLVF